MATIQELRANFTATFDGMTAGIRSIRKALQGIGESSEEAVKKANQAFKSFGNTLDKLQAELKKTGNQGEFKSLNSAIEKAQQELKETGKISEQSMKKLQDSVQKSKNKLGTMSDEGKHNLKEFKPLLNQIESQIQKLGGASGLKQMTREQRIAGLQTKKLSEVIDIQSRQLEEENRRYKDLSSGILGAGSKTQQLREKAEHLSNVLRIQGETVETLKRKYNDSVLSLGKNADATKQLERALDHVSSSMKNTENDLKHINANISAQSTLWGRLNTRLSDVRKKFNDLEESGSTVARTFGVATAVIGGGLGYTVKKAADFEQAMSNAESVMNPEDVKKYSRTLENLAIVQGNKTKYSATEAAEAIGELEKAGVSTAEIMHGGLKGALNLATAGELSLKDAAEIASTALNAFKDDNISVTDAANQLAGAANASATDVSEMKYALSAVSSVASGVGFSFKDTNTALAVLAQNGLKGSDAGTSLKTMLLNLSPSTKSAADMMESLGLATKNVSAAYQWLVDRGIKPASHSSKDVEAALQKLAKIQAGAGASASKVKKEYQELVKNSGFASSAFYDQHGKLKSLSEISGLLHDRLKNLTEEQRQYALQVIFGTDAIRAGNILYKEGADGADKMAKSISKIKASNVAKKKLDNFKGTLEQFRGSLETTAISVGEEMIPALRKLTEWVQKSIDWFNHLSPEMKHLIVNAALTTAGITGLATIFGGFFAIIGGGLNGLSSLIGLFTKIAGPLRIVRTAATGASAATAALGGAQTATAAAGTGLLGVLGPVALGIGAVTAAIGAGIFIHKLYKAHLAETDRALKKGMDSSQKFGDGVSKGTRKAASGFVNLREKAHLEMDKLSTATADDAKKISKDVVDAYGDMADKAIAKLQGMKKKSDSIFASIFAGTGTEGKNEQQDITGSADQVINKHIAKIKQAEKTIGDIYKKYHGDLSKANADDFARLQSAQQYLDGQVSVFAKSLKEQKAMMSSWSVESGHISYSTYKKEYANAKDSYEKSLKAAQSFYNQRKKTLKEDLNNGIINAKQYNEMMDKNNADLIANQAKAKNTFISINKALADNVKVTGDVYLKNGKTINDVNKIVTRDGRILYEDLKTHAMEDLETWTKNTKKYNEELLHSDTTTISMRSKAAKDYQKQMYTVYKQMGMSSKDAARQAKHDTEDLINSMSRAGSKTMALSQEIGNKFISGLKKTDTKDVAKQWGIDLNKYIDLGKYGTISGKAFIEAIKKGGKDAFPMLREFFRNQLDDMSKNIDLSDNGSQAVKTLKAGLKSGALTIPELKAKFGKKIYDLFPKSLNDIGENEIKTLQDGLKNHSISESVLKKKYGKQLKSIYSQSLSNMGEKSLTTLESALALGITNEKTLSKKYDKQLKSIYGKSLTNLGKDDITSLVLGYELGLPSAVNFFKDLKDKIKSGAKVNIKGSGTYTMSTLLKAFDEGKINAAQLMDGLSRLVKDKSNINLKKQGTHAGQTFSDGIKEKKKASGMAAIAHVKEITSAFNIGGKTKSEGKKAGTSYAGGITDVKKWTSAAAKSHAKAVKDGLSASGEAGKKGKEAGSSFASGLKNEEKSKKKSSKAAKAHADVVKDVLSIGKLTNKLGKDAGSKFAEGERSTKPKVKKESHDVGKTGLDQTSGAVRAIVKVINNLLKLFGIKSLKAVAVPRYKDGLNVPKFAIVGDGPWADSREIIHKKKTGKNYLTPNQDTLVELDEGDSVIPHTETQKVLEGKLIPKFASGWNIPTFIKTGFEKSKNFIENAWNNISSPTKMLTDALNSQISLKGLNPIIRGPVKGTMQLVEKGAGNWLKKKIEQATNPIGLGVERWIPTIKAAAAMSNVKLTKTSLSAILKRINKESGGNPTITQKIVDINSINGHPARGLLQYIPSTFAAWARKGYTNILNGFHQLLAMFNDSNWLHDISSPGGWGPTGHRRYRNGTKNHPGGSAVLGDDHKAEPFMLPDGTFGISPDKPTLFSWLPKGTKVWSSIQKFMSELPHYANGTAGLVDALSTKVSQMTKLQVPSFSPQPAAIAGLPSMGTKTGDSTESNLQAIISLFQQNNQLIYQFMDLVDKKPTGITEQQIYDANKRISDKKTRLDNMYRGVIK